MTKKIKKEDAIDKILAKERCRKFFVTIRGLDEDSHAKLLREAKQRDISLNRLCLAILESHLDEQFK